MDFNSLVSEVADIQAEKLDEIIRVTAEQGYNYLILMRETNYENDKLTMKFKCRGVHNKDEIPDGLKCELFDLSKVKEYLRTQQSTDDAES